MSYFTDGTIQFTDGGGLTLSEANANCINDTVGGPYALRLDDAGSGISRVEFYYASKPLDERFADFKKRLAAAMQRAGLS